MCIIKYLPRLSIIINLFFLMLVLIKKSGDISILLYSIPVGLLGAAFSFYLENKKERTILFLINLFLSMSYAYFFIIIGF